MNMKSLVTILSVIFLTLGIASYLGVAPADITGVKDDTKPIFVYSGGTGYYIGHLTGHITLTSDEYEVGEPISIDDCNLELTDSMPVGEQHATGWMITNIAYQIAWFKNSNLDYKTTKTMSAGTINDYGVPFNLPLSTKTYDNYLTLSEGDHVSVDIELEVTGQANEGTQDYGPSYWGYYGADIVADAGGGGQNQTYAQLDAHCQDAGGNALSGVSITMDTFSATSDTNGDFLISDIPLGEYSLTASKSGYETAIDTVRFTSEGVKQKTYTLLAIGEGDPDDNLDSDGDGYTDAEEIDAGTDPFDATDYPTGGGDDDTPSGTPIAFPPIYMIFFAIAGILIIVAIIIRYK